MLTYLPKPYPDELLYSVVARLGVHLGLNGYNLMELLFGHSRKAVVDLPRSLDYFANASFALWGLSSDDIIDKFTLFPIYSHFITKSRSLAVIETLKSNNATNSRVSHLAFSSTLDRTEFLRFCPQCFAADMDTYGESYWRRTHQIPGVILCKQHSSALVNSTKRYRTYPYQEFADATENLKGICREPISEVVECNDILIDITNYSYDLLHKKCNCLKFDVSCDAYRQAAVNLGFQKSIDRLQTDKLEEAFLDFYGEKTLSSMGLNFARHKNSYWFRTIFGKHLHTLRPIQHVLVHLFLEKMGKKIGSVDHLGNGPWKCPNPYADHMEDKPIQKVQIFSSDKGIRTASAKCSCGFNFTFQKVSNEDRSLPIVHNVHKYGFTWVNESQKYLVLGWELVKIAKHLNIDRKTLSDLLLKKQFAPINLSDSQIQANRNKWLELFKIAQSKTGAKRLDRALYNQLRLHDRLWHDSCQKGKMHAGSKCIDWEKRDKLISNEIYHIAAILFGKTPPVRVTIGIIAVESSFQHMLSNEKDLSRLPACRNALSVSVESLDDFYERKISHVVQLIINENLPITRARILRLANIKGARVSPRTEAALHKALNLYT